MKKLALLAIVLVLIGAGAYAIFVLKPKSPAGLKVNTTPNTSIFLNDKLIGKTPYDDKQPAGEYVLKLIPEESSSTVATWQGKIVLRPSLQTYVSRDLGESEVTSGGETLSFEKISVNQAEVEVSAVPDGSVVLFDGQDRGAAPQLLSDVLPGEHDIEVSSPGFISRTVRAVAISGYKLSVAFQLALNKTAEASSSATPAANVTGTPGKTDTKTTTGKPTIQIKDTPTGFLRVRGGPSTSATETAQVKPGETYPLLDESDGWYKILVDDKEGWVSGRYADKL